MQRKTIAVASPGGLGGRYHGPGVALSRVFNEAAAEGSEVVVLHGQGAEYECEFAALDCGSAQGMRQFSWSLQARRHLEAQRDRVALLQTAMLYTAPFMAGLAARTLGIPAFGRVASLASDIRAPSWRRPTSLAMLRRKLLNRLNGVVALSQDIRSELLAAGLAESKIFVIPNPVDLAAYRPAGEQERAELRRALGLEDTFLVVGCGVVIPRKGVKEAVEAIGRLAPGAPKVSLVWIGPHSADGYADSVMAVAREMGIADRVQLVGYRADVSRWLRAADAFVLPSANEGMPNALLEAMASGLPVLVSPVSGARDLIRDWSNGILIPRDPAAIAASLQRLLDDPVLRRQLGGNARRHMEDGYSPQHIWRMYRDMYEACGVAI